MSYPLFKSFLLENPCSELNCFRELAVIVVFLSLRLCGSFNRSCLADLRTDDLLRQSDHRLSERLLVHVATNVVTSMINRYCSINGRYRPFL